MTLSYVYNNISGIVSFDHLVEIYFEEKLYKDDHFTLILGEPFPFLAKENVKCKYIS